jgi:hypothetical protein
MDPGFVSPDLSNLVQSNNESATAEPTASTSSKDSESKEPEAENEAEKKPEEPVAVAVVEKASLKESEATIALRTVVASSESAKSWVKIKVVRDVADDESARVPITVSLFDARNGLIEHKLNSVSWKFLVEATLVEKEMNDNLKALMMNYM